MCTIIFSLEVVEPLHMEMLWPIDLSKILGDSLQKPPLMEILTERPGRLEKTLQRISFPLRTFSLSGLSPMEMASDTPAESHNPLNIFTKKPMTLTELSDGFNPVPSQQNKVVAPLSVLKPVLHLLRRQ